MSTRLNKLKFKGKEHSLVPYSYVEINNLLWMDYNLNVDDGGEGIYYPNDDINNVLDYGYLYSKQAIQRILLLYSSWRLPNEVDFDSLKSDGLSGKKCRESGDAYWIEGNTGTNEMLFNGRGAGGFSIDYLAPFEFKESLYLRYDIEDTQYFQLNRYNLEYWQGGHYGVSLACSVRLVKDI